MWLVNVWRRGRVHTQDFLKKKVQNPASQTFPVDMRHVSSLTKSFCGTDLETCHSTIDGFQA